LNESITGNPTTFTDNDWETESPAPLNASSVYWVVPVVEAATKLVEFPLIVLPFNLYERASDTSQTKFNWSLGETSIV